MTTMAALLGALPMAMGLGDGAELRQPLGLTIIGGLIMSQMLTLYSTPVVYLYLDSFRLWCRRSTGRQYLAALPRFAFQLICIAVIVYALWKLFTGIDYVLTSLLP